MKFTKFLPLSNFHFSIPPPFSSVALPLYRSIISISFNYGKGGSESELIKKSPHKRENCWQKKREKEK
jgi:hypothetical protein